ncbi:hypothetical protein [Bacteroides acidifaciens]|mgnify:CR=1 FL=1|uniref:hypothetical protein n=1 Tax=Bacteroides acidifaciens TaxID=85831 RepID=UPI00242C9494|nr:hypothetical protein [Bacteroides acidifaciens]
MRIIIVFFTIFLFASTDVSAQKKLFKEYRSECARLYDIEIIKPKGFKPIDKMVAFRVNERRNIGSFYRVALESGNKYCLILYPFFIKNSPHNIAKNMAYGEVKAALNLAPEEGEDMSMNQVDGKFVLARRKKRDDNERVIKFDTAHYMRVIAEDDMEKYFNADTVYVYDVPLLKPYKGIYKECIGINMVKRGHPSGMMKVLFMEGCDAKDKYLEHIFKSIRYSAIAPDYN